MEAIDADMGADMDVDTCALKPSASAQDTSAPDGDKPAFDCARTNKFLRNLQARIQQLPENDGMDVTLVQDIACMHARKRLTPWRPSQWSCLYGFGTTEKRNLAVRALRYGLGPGVLHGSNVGDNRWEALLQFDTRLHKADSEEFERFLGKFHMSIGVVELEVYLGPVMVACFERIQAGDRIFGNMHLKRNRMHLQNLEGVLRRKHEIEHTVRMEQEMGLDFTLSNMLNLHRSLTHEQRNRRALVQDVQLVQTRLADTVVGLTLVLSMVEHSSSNFDNWTETQATGRTGRTESTGELWAQTSDLWTELVRAQRGEGHALRVAPPPVRAERPGTPPYPPPAVLGSPGTPPYTPAAAEPLTPGLPYHSAQVDTPPAQPAPPVFDPNLRFERPVDVYAAPAPRDAVPGPAPRDRTRDQTRDRTHSIVARLQDAAADVRHARTVLLRVAASAAPDAVLASEPDYASLLLPPISVVIGGHMI